MSSNSPSDVNTSMRSSGRRVRFHHATFTPPRAGTTTTMTPELLTPLSAATAIASRYIATLHIGLTTFLNAITDQCLKAYSVYFHTSAKHNEMRLSPTHVPPSIKRIKLTLQPLDEIKESEDYRALQTRLAAETEALHRKWTVEYARQVDEWNCTILLQRFQAQVCTLLHKAAAGFIAQLGIHNYTASEAVIDFIGTKPNTALRTPLPLERTTLLQLYKDANHLLLLPKPTLVDDANYLTTIDKINTTPRKNELTLYHNGPSPASSLTTASQTRTSSPLKPSTQTPSTLNPTHTPPPPPHITPGTTTPGPFNLNTPDTSTPGSTQQVNTTSSQSSTTQESTTSDLRYSQMSSRWTVPRTLPQQSTRETPPSLPSSRGRGRGGGRAHTPTPTTQEWGRIRSPPDHQSPPPPPPPLPTQPRHNDFITGRALLATMTRETTPTSTIATAQRQSHLPRPTNQVANPNTTIAANNTTTTTSTTTTRHRHISSTQQEDDDISRINLPSLIATNNHQKVVHMLDLLYTNTITLPLHEFHKTVTQREELTRIKSVTATSNLETSAKKITEIIINEMPAERPVLTGLIREETERSTSGLKRKLQSALDQLEQNKKTLKLLTAHRQTQYNTEEKTKNANGSTMSWSRSHPVATDGRSQVAAATLPTYHHTIAPPSIP